MDGPQPEDDELVSIDLTKIHKLITDSGARGNPDEPNAAVGSESLSVSSIQALALGQCVCLRKALVVSSRCCGDSFRLTSGGSDRESGNVFQLPGDFPVSRTHTLNFIDPTRTQTNADRRAHIIALRGFRTSSVVSRRLFRSLSFIYVCMFFFGCYIDHAAPNGTLVIAAVAIVVGS